MVNKCEFSVYTVRSFMKCMYVCAAKTAYYFFTKGPRSPRGVVDKRYAL